MIDIDLIPSLLRKNRHIADTEMTYTIGISMSTSHPESRPPEKH